MEKIPRVSRVLSVLVILCSAIGISRGQALLDVKVPSQEDYKLFNVLDFGAKPDGKTDSAPSINKALHEACHLRGKALVMIPQGNYFAGPVMVSGPCTASSLAFVVKGTVRASSSHDLNRVTHGAEWITFDNIDGLIITGLGTLDGQGEKEWPSEGCSSKHCNRLPASLILNRVSNAVVRHIRSVNPKGIHLFVTNSHHIAISNVHLIAPATSPNTDGIHVSKSNRVEISNSTISTGDDCVSMIRGCTNVSIEQVTCGPGHGYSIGSLGHYDNESDVRGIKVRNCKMKETDNGLRIKTYQGSNPSRAYDIHFSDIEMTGVKNPIIIDQEYSNKGSDEPSQVAISEVYFNNVRGTTTSKAAVTLVCSQAVPCQGIHLNNIDLQYFEQLTWPESQAFRSVCTNANVIYSGTQRPPPC